MSLPPISFPGSPQRQGWDKALEAELRTAFEPKDQAGHNILSLRRRSFFPAGDLFSIASHMPE